MASFTDQPVQFTPYRPENPVEAELYVGMEKQREYSEGLQRVSGYISNLHGLPLDKPSLKEYLNSKISQMKGSVDKSVSGDFSDSRLVNQIGGLARQIASDPIIKNGVNSSTAYRKGLQDMEESKKNGKYSLSNDYDFSTEATKWLNDGDNSTVFNYSYTPYTDYNSKILKVLKDAGYDETTTELPYLTDERGNLLKDGNGHNILDTVKLQRTLKDNSGQVASLIKASLTADDYKQMAIDGKYHYRNTSPQQLKEGMDRSFKDAESNYSEQRLKILQGLSYEKNGDKIKQLTSQLSKIDNQYKQLSEDYKKNFNSLSSNPEQFKQSLFIDSYLNNIQKGLTTSISKTTEEASPRWQAWMEEQKFKDMQFRDERNYQLELQKFGSSEEFRQWEMSGKPTIAKPGTGGKNPNETPIGLSGKELDLGELYRSGTAKLIQQRDNNSLELALTALNNVSELQGKSKEEKMIWLNKNIPEGKTLNEVVQEWADKGAELWRSDPNGIPTEIAPLLSAQEDLNKSIQSRIQFQKNAEDYAQTITGGKGKRNLTWVEKELIERIQKKGGILPNELTSVENTNDYNKAVKEYYKNNTTTPQPQIHALGTDEKDKKRTEAVVASIVAGYLKQGAKIGDIGKAIAAGNSSYNIREIPPVNPGDEWQFSLNVIDKTGKQYSMPINKEQAQSLTGDSYGDIQDDIMNKISSSPFKSTNSYYDYKSPDAWKGAYFTPDKFRNIPTDEYTINADAVEVLGQPSGGDPASKMYSMKLYIKKKGESEFTMYQWPKNLSSTGIQTFPLVVTKAAIEQIMQQNK